MYPSASSPKAKEVDLKVQDPDPSHVGRNIVTLDKESKDLLLVTSGDIVEIEGTKKTAAVIWPARTEDEGKGIIRMDNFLRHNAGVNLGEKVKVRRAEVKEAKKVVLAPTQEVRIIASGYDRILKKNFIGRPLVRGDSVWISVFGSGFVYTVMDTTPRGIVKVNDFTQFVLKEQPAKQVLDVPRIAYEDIGGLGNQVQKVREMIELPMRHPELFRRLGINPPKGVLLFGPPGTGKTLLAKAVANETNAHFISVAAPALMCVGGETRILTNPTGEKTAEELFEEGLKDGKLVNDGTLKIVELKSPVKVFSVSNDLKIVRGVITHVTKLKAKTLQVRTSLGEKILVSSNHPFGVVNASKKLVWKKAGQLKKGDFVAVVKTPSGLPLESSKIKSCKIISIEPQEGEKELFDFTVEPFNNFLAGHSLLVLHNSKFVGEAEERIRQVFKEAEENAPSIIFFDEIDAIAPKRDEVIGEVERRVVAQLLASMDGMEARGNTIVIAASVTGDTPVLVKINGKTQLKMIAEVVDPYYTSGEEGTQKDSPGLEVLGMKRLETKHQMPWTYFGGSKFQPAKGVFRHKANEIYEIEFNGGTIRTTGNHSVFVRSHKGIVAKRVDELGLADVLVDLPYKVNRTTRSKMEIRSHGFSQLESPVTLSVYDSNIQEAYALLATNQASARQVSQTVGVHVSTAFGWKRRDRVPDFVRYHEEGIPNGVLVTLELMKLFGYYLAEGYARWELDFCFGAEEEDLIGETTDLMKRVFHVEPDELVVVDNRCNIIYRKKPLADFFARHCGKGAHNKKLPPFFFELPKEFFLNFLQAYMDGDGYQDKQERLEATSVSKPLIAELNWLCRMHGIKSYVHSFVAKEGRIIKGGKPLKETVAYRLGIGKINNPFLNFRKTPAQGLARIKKITKKPFDGFVYDLCGCEEEAFFGGDAPILLHNTNRVNSIDEALRRPGRFDREIEFPVPDKGGRKQVLQIHTRGMPLAKDVELDFFASITHGFVGADLAALVKESAMKALRRYLPKINLEEETIPPEVLETLEVNKKDFLEGLKDVQPSALREVTIEVPNVHWDQVGALDSVKEELKQAIEWPLKDPGAFKKMGIRPPKGVLLYGPPGCGKTLLAKAVATESEANFISIKGPELVSMWVGEAERGVRNIFKKARQVSPVIIFFDEIDSIAARRGGMMDSGVGDRMVNQLLTELDGVEALKDVVFIAATNRPDLIDPSLLRPGRIDKLVQIPAPDEKARLAILKVHSANVPLDSSIDLAEIANKTAGFSGADLEGLIQESALEALQESKMKPTKVQKKHVEKVLLKVVPSISEETEEAYAEFKVHQKEFNPSYAH